VGVFVHELHAPSIPESALTITDPTPSQACQEVMMIDVDWRQPFIDYIRKQKVPTDKNLAEQIICRAKSYVLVGDKLYRRGATSGVLMKCVPREEGKDILEEIHKGVYGNHASSRTLVSQAFQRVLTVNSCIKVRLDLQADKSPVVVKGPFFPRVVNPRYRIRGTMCNSRIQSSKAR
jgi:hypothetical protein